MDWLIDDRGVAWPGQAHRIASWHSTWDPFGYAVSELGYLHLQTTHHGTKVTFNPHCIGQRTIIAAFYLLASSRPRRVLLSFGNGPHAEIYGSIEQALYRIEECSKIPPRAVWRERRRSLDRPLKVFPPPIAELLLAWTETGARWNFEQHTSLAAAKLLEHAAVISKAGKSDQLIIDFWGPGRDFLGSRWAQIARGKDVQDQPGGHRLAVQIAARYRDVLSDRKPQLHSVDLVTPTSNGDARRSRFIRLLLPWTSAAGTGYVINAISSINSYII
jgi:hypothetical protein